MPEQYNMNDEAFSLPPNGKENPFVLPAAYFDQLPERIRMRIELLKELDEFPVLSAIQKDQLFGTPAGYFSENENSLESAFETEMFRTLEKVPEHLKVEEDYFEALDRKMALRLGLADELKAYRRLHAIDKQNNFAVAPDYFDTIAGQVKEKKYAAAHVPSFIERILAHILRPKTAFAYGLVLLIGLSSGWYYFHNTTGTGNNGDCKTLACLEKREILNEKTISDFNEEDLYEMIDAEALDKNFPADSIPAGTKNTDSTGK
jgi:hypothetical protein